jgi:hypothetical protein
LGRRATPNKKKEALYMGFDGKTVQLVVDGKKILKHVKQIEC